ncbi:hypothetical protein [Pleionea sediminis]|uniref:hypothetical protein n=1 Tax=Pleionea sediminis TaxID=2569479 RepID=UPI001185FB0F|nr:hypothetical protein [Pleionea sediminis]
MFKFLKAPLITFVSATSLSAFSETIDLSYNGESNFEMEPNVEYLIDIDLGKPYTEFSEICFDFNIDESRHPYGESAGSLTIGHESEEPIGLGWSVMTPFMWMMTPGVFDDNGNYIPPTETLSDPSPCLSMLSNSLKDGKAQIKITANNGPLFIDNLTLNFEGTPTSVLISLKQTSVLTFYPEAGGTLEYEARLGNFDPAMSRKRFKMWGVIMMPDDVPFPVLSERTFDVDYGETKEFLNRELIIPSWFKPGLHTMKWYVTEQGSDDIYSSELSFFKSESLDN